MTVISPEQHNILPAEDWDALGRATGQSGEEAKRRYIQALREHYAAPRPIRVRKVPNEEAFSEAVSGPGLSIHESYDATVVPGVLSLYFQVDIEGGEDWEGRVRISYKVFGHELGSSDNRISRTSSYIELHPGMLVAKADLQIGLWGENLCFSIRGQACHLSWTGWSCTPFDTSALFCLRS